ncbi:MAG: hypothetical protein JOZ69_05295 [Myxococcales bacterium]|nr:hypothetical protein [Myxococcales bacterium]
MNVDPRARRAGAHAGDGRRADNGRATAGEYVRLSTTYQLRIADDRLPCVA